MRVLRNEVREGRMPEALRTRPVLCRHLEHIWQGFWQLNTSRRRGMHGVDGLAPTDVAAWCALKHVTDTEHVLDLFVEMDAVYLRFVAAQQQQTKE